MVLRPFEREFGGPAVGWGILLAFFGLSGLFVLFLGALPRAPSPLPTICDGKACSRVTAASRP